MNNIEGGPQPDENEGVEIEKDTVIDKKPVAEVEGSDLNPKAVADELEKYLNSPEK